MRAGIELLERNSIWACFAYLTHNESREGEKDICAGIPCLPKERGYKCIIARGLRLCVRLGNCNGCQRTCAKAEANFAKSDVVVEAH